MTTFLFQCKRCGTVFEVAGKCGESPTPPTHCEAQETRRIYAQTINTGFSPRKPDYVNIQHQHCG